MKVLARSLTTIAVGVALAIIFFTGTGVNPFTGGDFNAALIALSFAFLVTPGILLNYSKLDDVFYYRMGYQDSESLFFVDAHLAWVVVGILLFFPGLGVPIGALMLFLISFIVVGTVVATVYVRSRKYEELEIVRFVDAEVEDGEHG